MASKKEVEGANVAGQEDELKKKSAELSIYEGSGTAVMDGFGQKYITPYALALGASNTQIGVLSSLPSLLGTLTQLKSSRSLEKTSRKKIILWSVSLQAFMWLPLIAVGLLYFYYGLSVMWATALLIALYIILTLAGSYAGPAWVSWMRDLVTSNRDSYFGRRNKIVGFAGLVSLGVAGAVLKIFENSDVMMGFAILFFVAFLGRSFSAYLFTKHYEPKINYNKEYYFSFMQFVRKMPSNNFGRFAIFSAISSGVVAVSSPFFAVYMLKYLGFSYIEFAFVTIGGMVATLFAMTHWGRFGDKYGNVQMLKTSGRFVFLIPLLWAASPIVIGFGEEFILPYLFLVEIFSGIVWAGFSLSTGTFVYHAATRERLALCTAYTNILNALAAFVGALIGGWMSGVDREIFGMQSIIAVFVLSAILRLIVVAFLLPMFKEVRSVETFTDRLTLRSIESRMMKYLRIGGVKRTGVET